MSQKPEVSVIMSVYNGLPYLKQAAQSILRQSFKNFEFIIVDDASQDGTWNYLINLKDKRVKLIKNNKNLGLAASLNKTLKLAKGEYIARMDADDISLPNRLEEQLKFMKKNAEIDLCGAWADLIDEEGNIIGEKKFYTEDSKIKKALAIYSPIIHPTLFAKTEIFKNLGGYDKNFEFAEDYEFLLRTKETIKFANIPQKLFKWRLWDERRSRAEMHKIDKADLKAKINALKKGYFPITYFPVVALKLFVTFFTPYSIKKTIAKKIKLA